MRGLARHLWLGAALIAAAPALAQDAGALLLRLEALEAEQRRLVGELEQAQNALRQLRAESDNRIRDLEFRVIELEGGDPSAAFRDSASASPAETSPAATASPPRSLGTLSAPTPDIPDSPSAEALRAGAEAAAAGRMEEAARHYLDGYRADQNAAQAPALLAGLGETLSRLGHADQACAAFAEFASRFPGAPETLTARVTQGRAASGCR